MSLLTRAVQKIFGLTGGTGEFGQIGSKAAGAPVTTKNLETMQALSKYDQGLNAIVSDQGTSVLPYLEDINSLFFLTTSQIAYLMQSGIPEWNAETEYYLNISLVTEGGITYKDTFGTGGTPNLNFLPSTNPSKWEAVLGSKKVEFETSKDLVTNFISSTQARATFSRMSLLDSNNIPKYLNNKSLTWTMPGDLESGQSEEASKDYGCWVDSDENLRLVADIESVTDGVTAGFLDDSANAFFDKLVKAGDIVYNLDDITETTVKTDATVNGDPLELNDDIFTSSPKDYKIVKMSPEGLGENRERLFTVLNNGSSNFDDSWYTQLQEVKKYTGVGDLNFTLTAPGWTTSFADSRIRQVNDWTGKGTWMNDFNYSGPVTAASTITLGGTGLLYAITPAGLSHAVTVTHDDANSISINRGLATEGADSLFAAFSSNVTNVNWSGDVPLVRKPTYHDIPQ